MGRPRKLRPEDLSATASLEQQGEVTTMSSNTQTIAVTKNGAKNDLLPFLGAESLEVGIPRYFLNGKKLIQVRKIKKGEDENKNPTYVIKRQLARTINKNSKDGKRMIDILVKFKIPGV